MFCDIAMKDAPPVMRNDEKAIQDTKVNFGMVRKSIAAITSR
jgi:hypothetical protein